MALTEATLTIAITLITMLASVIVCHYLGRAPDTGSVPSLLAGGIVLPVVFLIVFAPFYAQVTLFDWPSGYYDFPPQVVVWIGGIVGGLIGFYSGESWNKEGTVNCLVFFLVPIMLLVILSIVVVFLP
ncbi:MAG: hypothetical protein ACFFFC_15870 [Candidatus Thorarchaeota archaeon]